MKQFGVLGLVLALALPVGAARKLSIDQMKQLLISLHDAHKTDAEVAAELGDVELTEELSLGTMNSLAPNLPGPLSNEQLYVLEVRSAVLPPPPGDIPSTPAPDPAAQKTILDKAADYVNKTWAQLPPLTATKSTRRFQDSTQIGQVSLGSHSTAAVGGSTTPIRYTASADTPVTLRNGAEQNPLANDKTHWGDNGMIALLGPPPGLTSVLQDAQAAGKIGFLRWQTVNGHTLAVFSFAVDKKKSHYAVDYCCFPEETQAGQMSMRGTESPGGAGNYLTNASWKPFKATVAYHGELLIQPDTGAVVRLIVAAEFKGADPVKLENQRIDFGIETVGGKPELVPVHSFIDTMEHPYPDSAQGRYIERHTLFLSEYKDYKAGN
jgi:hypothetical protein